MHIGYWWESQKERDHWEDQDVGWRILLKWILRERGWVGMELIHVAQDRYQWRALVNAIMNLRVPKNAGKVLSSCTTGGFSKRAQLRGVSYVQNVVRKGTVVVNDSDGYFSM
jgi:hypothetical protein